MLEPFTRMRQNDPVENTGVWEARKLVAIGFEYFGAYSV